MTKTGGPAELERMEQARTHGVPWRKWGPYLSERQWGTVREDYSEDGDAWSHFTLARYTRDRIGSALGVPTLRAILDDQYEDLPGGRLEAIGRLFKSAVKLYVYPTVDPESREVVTADTMRVDPAMRHLYQFLLDNRRIEGLDRYDASLLQIRTPDVLARLQRGDPDWESAAPGPVAAFIKERRLFGLRPG